MSSSLLPSLAQSRLRKGGRGEGGKGECSASLALTLRSFFPSPSLLFCFLSPHDQRKYPDFIRYRHMLRTGLQSLRSTTLSSYLSRQHGRQNRLLPRTPNYHPLRRPAASAFRHPTTTLSPLFSTTSRVMASQQYKLKDVTSLSLKPGDKLEAEVEGLDVKVLLVHSGGKVQAVGPKCTHYGAPLVKGVLSTNGRLTCPWHGGK